MQKQIIQHPNGEYLYKVKRNGYSDCKDCYLKNHTSIYLRDNCCHYSEVNEYKYIHVNSEKEILKRENKIRIWKLLYKLHMVLFILTIISYLGFLILDIYNASHPLLKIKIIDLLNPDNYIIYIILFIIFLYSSLMLNHIIYILDKMSFLKARYKFK